MTSSRVLPAAVAVLAHARLRDAEERLNAKIAGFGSTADAGLGAGLRPVEVRATERRVHALLTAAINQVRGPGGPADLGLSSPLRPGPGRFSVLGTVGFDLPGYAGMLGPDPSWINQILRTGSPDPTYLPVVAETAALPLLVQQRAVDAGTDPEIARAFAHGMLDAAATSILVDPVLRGMSARNSTKDWRPFDPRPETTGADRRALIELFGSDGSARWLGAWPTADQVPESLLTGYLQAIEETHHLASGRPTGWSSFEAGFSPGGVPTAHELHAAYQLLRFDVTLSSWSGVQWWAFLLPLWGTPALSLILAKYATPNGAAFFENRPLDDSSWSELLSLSTMLGSLTPFVWSMLLWSQLPDQSGLFAESLVLFLLRLGLGVWWTASTASGPVDPGVRFAQFGLQAGTDVYALIRAFVDIGQGKSFPAFVHFLQLLPTATGLWTTLLGLIGKGVGVSDDGGFWAYWGVTTALQLIAGIPIAAALTGSGLRSFLAGSGASWMRATEGLRAYSDPRLADPAGHAATFDESTLWAHGGAGAPDLSHLRYPPGTKAIVKVWFDGVGDCTIAHDGHTVTLRHDGGDVPVDVPRGARTPGALAAALEAAVPGIHTAVVDASPAVDLPWPSALADPGDRESTMAAHDAKAAEPQAIGGSESDAYLLAHAPMVDHLTTVGLGGAAVNAADRIPIVPGRTIGDFEQTALGTAADLATLLHLGAAPWFETVVPNAVVPALPALAKSYEVFRHWNLDARRVDEWRLLVAGGAESDKGGLPAVADVGMLTGRAADSAAPAGAAVAAALGWVPLWRAWLRVAADITADTDAAVVMPYTPVAIRSDGSSFQPSNADLTAGIRYLLDLP